MHVIDETPRARWLILGCAWLLGFAMYTPILCIPPMEHIIKAELALSHAQMGLLFSLPIIMLAIVAIPSGLLADRIGIRKAAGIGIILIVMGSLLRGAAAEFEALFAFTVLFGVGFALVYPNLPKLISAWFSSEQAGLATGIYATGIMTAASLSLGITLPVIFPVTNTYQGTLYIWSIPSIVAAITWWLIVRENPKGKVQNPRSDKRNNASIIIRKNKNIWLVAISLFLLNFHFYVWAGWSPALMMLKGAPAGLATLITSVMSWTTIPIVFIIPWVSYKLGVRKPIFFISTILLIFISLSAIYTSVPFFWFLMILIGITLGGTFSMILALPVEMVPKESVGMASGMILSIGYIGGLIGPWIAGYIFDITENLNLALSLLAVVAVVWTIVSFLIPETGPKAKLKPMN